MDSGGPVLWKNPSTKRLVLVGIISSGTDCGGASPGVNTRVGSFMDFIWDQRPQRGNYYFYLFVYIFFLFRLNRLKFFHVLHFRI